MYQKIDIMGDPENLTMMNNTDGVFNPIMIFKPSEDPADNQTLDLGGDIAYEMWNSLESKKNYSKTEENVIHDDYEHEDHIDYEDIPSTKYIREYKITILDDKCLVTFTENCQQRDNDWESYGELNSMIRCSTSVNLEELESAFQLLYDSTIIR